jgi:ribonuclease P protein component
LADETLKRHQRVKSKKEISLFFKERKMVSSNCMCVFISSGENASLKVGVAAGKSFENAVERNRAKRLLREVYRRLRHRLSGKCNVFLVARKPILKSNFEKLKEEFLDNAAKLEILKR